MDAPTEEQAQHWPDGLAHSARPPRVAHEAATLLGAVASVAVCWRLSPSEVAAVLGVSEATYTAWRAAGPPAVLDAACVTRIGHLLAIYAETQAFYGVGTTIAATWLDRPGTAANDCDPARPSLTGSTESLAALRVAVRRRVSL